MAGNAGVVLAGGKSSRMGENKGEMLLAGEPMLRRVLRRLAPAVDDLVVIGPATVDPGVPQARVVSDIIPGRGPLGGLYTALVTTQCDHIFLVACDMPFVQRGLVRAMLTLAQANPAADAVVLQSGDGAQPLHAVYAAECLPAVEQALASGNYSLRSLLNRLSVVTVDAAVINQDDPLGISAFNVNTPADWQRAQRLANKLESSPSANDGR